METCCTIRKMYQEDCAYFAEAFGKQGWHKPESGFQKYFAMQERKEHIVLVAVWEGNPAGYLIVRPQAQEGPFACMGIPELADLNVLEIYQNKGIGGRLLGKAEALCQGIGCVSLAVGLHSGYGRAQRMYVKRGYLFDGSGVWYRGKQLGQYAFCRNDDDLVLYMKKEL